MNTMLAFFFSTGPWDLLMIPGMLLGLYAQMKLTSTYNKFSQMPCDAGVTGAEAARRVLDSEGLYNLPVYEVPGHLSDHYDPIK